MDNRAVVYEALCKLTSRLEQKPDPLSSTLSGALSKKGYWVWYRTGWHPCGVFSTVSRLLSLLENIDPEYRFAVEPGRLTLRAFGTEHVATLPRPVPVHKIDDALAQMICDEVVIPE